MIICFCNNLREKDMATAIAEGAQCAGDVYKHHGCKPQCGKCVPYVRDAIPSGCAAMTQVAQ
ncbi:MAG: hypothetical protein FJX23_02800 [Alphaproteobacteria bacterium]|nr:hypothetical protein [Alphaproteobacteria bacterium]